MNYRQHTMLQSQSSQSVGGSVGLSGGSMQVVCAPMQKVKQHADCALM